MKSFRDLPPDAWAWIVTLSALVPLTWLLLHGFFSLLAFLIVTSALIILVQFDKRTAIAVLLVYLFLLGDIRRIIGMFIGFPKIDPLLLVGPIVTILLAVPILMRLRLRDPISKVMVGLMAVMLLEIVNPHQGSIVVGLAGAMFYLLPILWFWIGRHYGTDKMLYIVIYWVTIPLAVVAGVLGLCQTYIGFLPWESAWIAAVAGHYHALNLGGGFIRAFGFSVNSVEYAGLELVGCTIVLAAFFAGKRAYGLLFPLLAFTLFLASSRTAIVKLLFSVSVAWALSSKGGKGWAVRLPIAIAVIFGVLVLALSRVSSSGIQGTGTAAGLSANHQIQGLSHPLDEKKSTAGLHVFYFLGGFKDAFSYPIGYGLGAATMGTKLGDEGSPGSSSTEVDISDAFVTMGLPGGLLYLFTIFLVIKSAIRFGQTAPKYLGLPTIAILAAMGGAWIALGQYGMGPLLWFFIGAVARSTDKGWERAKEIPQFPPTGPQRVRPAATALGSW